MYYEKAIEVERVSKLYKIYKKPSDRLLAEIFNANQRSCNEFWAIKDITFTLDKGETLGIVGRNGAGKSTLLQVICGTIEPTEGNINVNGRIGALLELGSGFNPEFSGLENAELNAAILGLNKKEIRDKLDEIIKFADIGEFINQPVKNYSSGMVMRLAFAVQAHISPSILVVDEALAVGDEMFQRKCFARLEKLKAQGTSIVLVSHSASQIIRHCDKVIMLDRGEKIIEGPAQRTTEIYQQLIQIERNRWSKVLSEIDANKKDFIKNNRESINEGSEKSNIADSAYFDKNLRAKEQIIYEEKDIRFIDIRVVEPGSTKRINNIPSDKDFNVILRFEALVNMEGIRIGCLIGDKEGCKLGGMAYPEKQGMHKGRRKIIELEFRNILWPGYIL